VEIRRATEGDLETILALVRGGRVANGAPPPAATAAKTTPLPADVAKAFAAILRSENDELMVASYHGAVVGTFHLTWLHYLAAAGRPDLQIEAVHVASAFRGRGIGGVMMSWAIERAKARNSRRVQLTSDKQRPDAHRFYQRLGFTPTHEGFKMVFAAPT
jgi:GNAT superfamily N-acetyltransferase